MKKYCMLLLLLASVMLLSSCYGGSRMRIFDDSGMRADARLEQLLEILVNKDDAALKSMFSTQTLEMAANFDDSVEYLFELFQGDVVSWEQVGRASDARMRDGKRSVQVRARFAVITDKDEYEFYLIDYLEDTINPDNVGLFVLQVVRTEDRETQMTGYWTDLSPGIFMPGE